MANKALFGSTRGRATPKATTKNAAGGAAYAFTPEHALAQLACTGTFNDTFYEKGADQLKAIRQAADQCSPEFIAQVAIYARTKGYMKDMPAALAVMLSKADPALLDKVFDPLSIGRNPRFDCLFGIRVYTEPASHEELHYGRLFPWRIAG